MVSLLDDHDGLRITVQDLRDPARRRFEFTFRAVAAYRNILEEYRMGEVMAGLRKGPGVGWTAVVVSSAWLAELKAREPLLDVHAPGCQHFSIETEDDTIDIITPEEPEIREIAPAAPGERPPGKSEILDGPDDRAEIDRLFRRLRGEDEGTPDPDSNSPA